MQKNNENENRTTNAKPVFTRATYVALYGPYVMEALKDKPLFASVMMAQAILESASAQGVPGGSSLASKYNNHFGIKADASWQGQKVELNTREFIKGEEKIVKAMFRVYEHAHDSFHDRIAFLLKNKRYLRAGVFYARTPSDQANALQRAGYATDPDYAKKLIGLVDKLGLSTFDRNKVEPGSDASRPPLSSNRISKLTSKKSKE